MRWNSEARLRGFGRILTCSNLAAWVVLLTFMLGAESTWGQDDSAPAETSETTETTDTGESDEPADSTEDSLPATADDPEIPTEHLELLVKPLTKEELIAEADGWRDLLKANAQEIADHRIGVMEQREIAQDAAGAGGGDEEKSSEQPTAAEAEEAEEEKQELADKLATLTAEKLAIGTRLNIVLDELESKGGDVEDYRKYASSLTGIVVEVGDASTAWTVARGWLTSEDGGQRLAWNILKFAVILVLFYFGAAIAARLVRHAAGRIRGISQLLVNFLGSFVKQVILVIGFIVGLAALEVNITPLLAAVGAAGFVIGFALQDTLSNFASGMLILAYRPFDVGDVVEVAGISGKVESVSLFSTHILTFDNKLIIVPNNDIWGNSITNASARSTRRVDLVFGIGYDDNIEQALDILKSVVERHELVLPNPEPTIQVNELGDSSINLICRPWTKTADYWSVYWDITRTVKEEFDRSGISIPFPQRDIHVYQQSATPDTAPAPQ